MHTHVKAQMDEVAMVEWETSASAHTHTTKVSVAMDVKSKAAEKKW
jgi:tRNA A37 threonylcarbamoyladenosine biosynthesis protein TsaE